MQFLEQRRDQALALFRIVIGLLFLIHGVQKIMKGTPLLSWPGGPMSLIELIGGGLILIGLWTRWAAFVQRRPAPIAAAGLLLLVVAALPVLGMRLGVADASNDPRQAADIARSDGYLPESILCVPLFYGDEVIGVLEML